MFMSAEAPKLRGDHLDFSYQDSSGWDFTQLGDDMRTLTFALGDEERGAMVMLVSITTQPGDEAKFPPIIHMHRSDSFRTFLKGDFYVGRQIYADGLARLQASGTYYGPEQPGPKAIASSGEIWSLLVFGDKRGHRVQPADKKYLPMVAAINEVHDPFYRKLGVIRALPDESMGETDIRTNLDLQLRRGYADVDPAHAEGWPMIGDAAVAVMTLGDTECGPLVLGISAAADVSTVPAAIWDTELLIAVVRGSMEIDGTRYGAGDMRIQAAGATLPAMVAGSDGLQAYVVLGDRRGALPAVATTDAAARRWVEAFAAMLAPMSEAPTVAEAALA